MINKTGTRQCPRTNWNTFADIHSTHPGALMHWNFQLEFVMPHTSQHTHKTYLIYPMIAISETPGLSITFGTLLACRWRIIEPSLAAFIGFPFAVLFTCTFTECVTLHHEVHELDGYDHEFWKNSGYSLKCVLELIASTLHAKSLQRHPTQLGSREHLRRLRFSLAY